MTGYTITEAQSKSLSAVLSDLAVQGEADAVFMSDYGGNIIAHFSQSQEAVMQTMAALAAGSFCATRELAGLIGEPTFHSIFHQGQHACIYMQSVAANFLLLVIFGKSTTAGLIKLYVEKACRELEPIIQEVVGQTPESVGCGKSFEIDTVKPLFRKSK